MICKYKKKPVVIEAVKYTGFNLVEIQKFIGDKLETDFYDNGVTAPILSIIIPTLEGNMTAKPGDYIIKGVNGEFYPCKTDIFNKTYDLVE